MDTRLEKLEKAIEALEAVVSRHERRLATLEGEAAEPRHGEGATPEAVEIAGSDTEDLSDQWPATAIKGTPALVGRSLLILAGAFFLRALTESGTIANGTGVVLGLAYAATWIVATALAARGGARVSAGFFGVCAAIIADPLVFEASTEFGVLSATGGSATLAVVTAAGLIVASRWRLPESAWVFVIGAMVTGAALAVVRPPGEAATSLLVAVGLAAVWLAGVHGWESLRWLTAIGANVGVLRLTAMATAPGGPHGIDPPHLPLVVALQAVLLLGYVGSSFTRALRRRLPVRVFDYLQTALAWAIGWGGAVQIAEANKFGTGGLSVFALLVGFAAYAAAFGVVGRRQRRSGSFFYLSTLGIALIVIALPNIAGGMSAVVWAVLALVAAAAGSRWDWVTLRVHATLLLLAAWFSSGMAAEAARDLSGLSGASAVPGLAAIVVAILTAFTTVVVLGARRLESSSSVRRLPLTGLLVMSGVAVASAVVSLAELVAPSSALWMGTVALSMMAIVSAALASRWGIREAGWIVYPLLAATGIRVVFVDIASGRTIVLVMALAAYGAALIVSPKILRSRSFESRM